MKYNIVFLLVIAYGVTGYIIVAPKTETVLKYDQNDSWVTKQTLILNLFENIRNKSIDPTIVRLANEFTFDLLDDENVDPETIQNFKLLTSTKKLIPKEFKTIYDVLYSAKSFDMFYSIASYLRQNVNYAVFMDAMFAVIPSRKGMENIMIPPPYELVPDFFISKDVLNSISDNYGTLEPKDSSYLSLEENLDRNYTNLFNLTYYLEDVGLNTYIYLQRLQFLINKDEEKNGAHFIQFLRQLIARYNLELYANGVTDVKEFELSDTSDDNKPMIEDRNKININLKTLNNTINDYITSLLTNGIEDEKILNNLIDVLGFGDDNIFDMSFLDKLEYNEYSNEQYLSNRCRYMAMLRDPVYWQKMKDVITIIDKTLTESKSYTRNELYFPGVRVSNVLVKKMQTTFENFEINVAASNNGLNNNGVKINQTRLNHKQFTIKINVTSLFPKRALIKMYLAPKLSPSQLNMEKDSFFLLDSFIYDLKKGSNIVTRKSDQLTVSPDLLSTESILTNIEDAKFGLDTFSSNIFDTYANFPSRLLLPKGSVSGTSFQLLIFVGPYLIFGADSLIKLNEAISSPGYPLDYLQDINMLYNLPNSMLKEIIITHKGDKSTSNYENKYSTMNDSLKTSTPQKYDYTKYKSYNYTSKNEQFADNSNKNADIHDSENLNTGMNKPVEYKNTLELNEDLTDTKNYSEEQ